MQIPSKQFPILISASEVRRRTSLSRATIWRRVRAGDFPAPVRLGVSRIAWREADVTNWIETRTSAGEEV